MNLKLKKSGIGCVEAARGTLIHHYITDDRGMLTKANLYRGYPAQCRPDMPFREKSSPGIR